MAKRPKTDAKDVQDPKRTTNATTSELIIGIIGAATRTPDMNKVDISDDISEITPGSKLLSDSDVPPRLEKVKKKMKRHTKEEHSKKHPADDEMSKKKDVKSDDRDTDVEAKS